jgi:hypothetical protein
LPGVGKFASADSIVPDPANPQAWNRFSYVLNNPIGLTDPSGHCAKNPDGSRNFSDADGTSTCWRIYHYLTHDLKYPGLSDDWDYSFSANSTDLQIGSGGDVSFGYEQVLCPAKICNMIYDSAILVNGSILMHVWKMTDYNTSNVRSAGGFSYEVIEDITIRWEESFITVAQGGEALALFVAYVQYYMTGQAEQARSAYSAMTNAFVAGLAYGAGDIPTAVGSAIASFDSLATMSTTDMTDRLNQAYDTVTHAKSMSYNVFGMDDGMAPLPSLPPLISWKTTLKVKNSAHGIWGISGWWNN